MAKGLAPITADHGWFIGESHTFTFSIKQADEVTPQNITGWAIEWVVRADPESNTALITKTTGSGAITLTNPTGGICTVAVTRADTLTLSPDILWHTLRRTDTGSESVQSYGPAVLRFASTR